MKTILLIEDDEKIQQAVARNVKSHGGTLLSAMTVDQGRELFDQHGAEIDIILFDGQVSGPVSLTCELVKYLKPKFQGELIAISNRNDYVEALLEAGCTRSIAKISLVTELPKLINPPT